MPMLVDMLLVMLLQLQLLLPQLLLSALLPLLLSSLLPPLLLLSALLLLPLSPSLHLWLLLLPLLLRLLPLLLRSVLLSPLSLPASSTPRMRTRTILSDTATSTVPDKNQETLSLESSDLTPMDSEPTTMSLMDLASVTFKRSNYQTNTKRH